MREPSLQEKEQLVELTELFQKLGADEPESWAKSEVMENIPQLARFLFLRAAWKKIISENSTDWIDWEIQYSTRKPNDPCAGIGHSLKNLLELGASREDVTNLVRGMQYKTLFDICYLIDDLNEEIPEIGKFGWALYERDKDGKMTGRIVQGMHEDALSMDPTGREMRPRNNEIK